MLTEKQEAILEYVRQVQAERSVPPSTREIQRHFGHASQNAAMSHLRALARKEQIEQLADGRWGNKAAQVQGQLFEMQVYGEIPAGLPAMREQEPLESIPVDPRFFGVKNAKPQQLWALRVRGDSMIDAGILDGDIVIMARRDPKPGDVIAALVDDTEVTLKRLVKEKGRMVLRAANPRYPDLAPRKIETQGVMVGVIRRA
ncbi:MAG TPA: transcriptional repressor LexA [Opitutaceae bacterium]|jgi:repressor LexA|nr:transcriptional repressor LexA [Opitutaceae bacterium]